MAAMEEGAQPFSRRPPGDELVTKTQYDRGAV
jgi:hypothetical protein